MPTIRRIANSHSARFLMLGLVALAEGIETEVQLTTLVALGCEFGQGYWFSRPVGADVAETLIGHRLPLLVVQ